MSDNIWTAKNAAEYVSEALDGCGEEPAEYDIDAIVRTLYLHAGTHDLRVVDTDLFWSVVWENQRTTTTTTHYEVSMEDVSLLREAEHDPHVEIEGVLRRLAATVDSMTDRRDGQTHLYTGEPQLSNPPDWVYTRTVGRDFRSRSIPVVWESLEGCWSSRAWRLHAQLNVTVETDYGDTFMTLTEPTLAVVGRTGATIFCGQGLSLLLVPALQRRMARQWAREVTGAHLGEDEEVDFAKVWDLSPEDWVAQRPRNEAI